MSWLPSINELCERSLRKIGTFGIRDSGARPAEMEEARYWLDMHMGHVVGTKRTWWNVPRSATFQLTAGTTEYDLISNLGAAAAPDGVEFVIGVYLLGQPVGGVQTLLREVKVVRRQEFEVLTPDASDVAQSPTICYIDRKQRPTLFFLEAPDANQTYWAKLLFQSYAPNLVSQRGVNREALFRSSYTLYIVTALAALIGDGPVRKLPADEVKTMKQDRDKLWLDLEGYEDQEQNNAPARVNFYNGV